MLERITGLINDVVVKEGAGTKLTTDDVVALIGVCMRACVCFYKA
jgi:hypothetical protein